MACIVTSCSRHFESDGILIYAVKPRDFAAFRASSGVPWRILCKPASRAPSSMSTLKTNGAMAKHKRAGTVGQVAAIACRLPPFGALLPLYEKSRSVHQAKVRRCKQTPFWMYACSTKQWLGKFRALSSYPLRWELCRIYGRSPGMHKLADG